jgi:hypothetical protein
MSSVVTRAKPSEKAVKSFFDEVKALSGAAGEFTKVSHAVLFQNRRQAHARVRELQSLEQKIHQLKSRIAKEAEVERPGSLEAPRSPAASDKETADSVLQNLEQMVHRGELLPSTEFIAKLGLSKQAVSKAVGANRMFYVDYKGDRYFPGFYADPMYPRAQLEAVTKLLGDLPGGAKLQFFLNRRGSLAGGTPLEAIAVGKLQKVKDLAAEFADQR